MTNLPANFDDYKSRAPDDEWQPPEPPEREPTEEELEEWRRKLAERKENQCN